MADWSNSRYSRREDDRLPFTFNYRDDYYNERESFPRRDYDWTPEYRDEGRYPLRPPYWDDTRDRPVQSVHDRLEPRREPRWPEPEEDYFRGQSSTNSYQTRLYREPQPPLHSSIIRQSLYKDFTSDIRSGDNYGSHPRHHVRDRWRRSPPPTGRNKDFLIRDRSPTKYVPTSHIPHTIAASTRKIDLSHVKNEDQPPAAKRPKEQSLPFPLPTSISKDTATSKQPSIASDGGHYCKDCNVYASSKEHLIAHFQGKKHLRKVGKLSTDQQVQSDPPTDQQVQSDPPTDQQVQSDLPAPYDDAVTVMVCTICGKHVLKDELDETEHTETKRHQKWVQIYHKKNKTENIEIENLFQEVSMSGEETSSVLKLEENEDGYRCDVCDVIVNTYPSYKQHIEGLKHRKATQHQDNQTKYHCDICDVYVQGERCYLAHLQGQKHRKNSNKLENPTTAIVKYDCSVCGISCTSQAGYDQHINGKQHLKKMKQVK